MIRSFTEDTFVWGDYVGREFPTWLDRPDELAIVAADDNDSPVAVARVGLLSEAEAWLSGARVHPDHRRQGIGSVMNDFGVEWARERGAKVIRLATEEDNMRRPGARSKSSDTGRSPDSSLAVRPSRGQRPLQAPEPGPTEDGG